MGEAHIVTPDDQTRSAACIGGMLTVLGGRVRLIATTWEWAEQIDAGPCLSAAVSAPRPA